MNADLPFIDICTPVYRGRDFIDRYFEGFLKQEYPREKIRINIIDNSPDDESYNYIKENYLENQDFPIKINLFKSEKNLGFSGGNNFLFEKFINDSSHPYFFLLNQDGSLKEAALIELAKMAALHRDTGMFEAVQHPREHPKEYDSVTFETSWCSGGGVLINKEALKETGFFDHRFFLYCEDVDLSWRMWLKGWKCRVCPGASYEHITEELDESRDQSIRYFYSFRNGFFVNIKYNSFTGILRYYVLAFLVCFKQDSSRRSSFLRAYFAAQKYAPYYLLNRILNPLGKKPQWIYFDNFEFGKRRKYVDTPDGKRVFV